MTGVAYLVNQYPKVSHSFVRREILALERNGTSVERFAVRGEDAPLVDAADVAEQARTTYLLANGAGALLKDFFATLATRPSRLARAFRMAIDLGRRADRPLWIHAIYLLEACRLHRLMQARKVRHVHAHFGTNGTTVALLCAELGDVTYSFTVHGPEEFDKPQAIRLGTKIGKAAFVVAITSFCRSQLFRWGLPSEWDKIVVVRCGLGRDFLDAEPTPIPETPQLLCIGRLCEQKGQLLLVRAAALLKNEGVPFQLVLAGDGEMRGDLEREIREHGLEAHVRITGWIDAATVRSLLVASRALVLPSFAEGLPVVVMEAMAMARPVLTTRIAGHAELVRSEDNGWLIDAGSIDALVESMRDLLATPVADLQAMGLRGRARVAQLHDVDQEAAKLARLFEQIPAPGAVGARA